MLEDKITLANQKLNKVVELIKKNEEIFLPMNLKLYDVSYYMYEEMKNDFPNLYKHEDRNYDKRDCELFNMFCEQSYDMMIEDFDYMGIDYHSMVHHIGRTSSFCLHDEYGYFTNNHGRVGKSEYDKIIEYAIEQFFSCNCISVDDGKISWIDEDYIEDAEEQLDYIISDFDSDIEDKLKEMIYVNDYIKDFKENQVERFKEFLSEL